LPVTNTLVNYGRKSFVTFVPDSLEHAAHDVDVVEDGQHDEDPVEGVAHLLGAQHRNHQAVGQKAEQA
jgi:hypothetical protein